jgi:hypothetical protein
MNVAAQLLVGSEIQKRLGEVADARIVDARNVPVVRSGDEIVGHRHFDVARIGRVVEPIGVGGCPRLIDAQHVIFWKGLSGGEERLARIEVIRVRRTAAREAQRRREVGDVAEERRRGDDDARIVLRDDRC